MLTTFGMEFAINTKINKYITYGIISTFCVLIFIGTYVRIWEERQPKRHITKTIVRSIEPYSHTNELHWSFRGFKIYINEVDKPIDFPLKNWDDTVEVGDTVDLVVRKSYQWLGLKDELDGLNIDDHK